MPNVTWELLLPVSAKLRKDPQLSREGKREEVAGLPCYLHIGEDYGWSGEFNGAGYNDEYRTSTELNPGDHLSFRIVVPAFIDTRERPTGKLFIFSRFAVSQNPGKAFSIQNGPESSLLIVDMAKLENALKTLKSGLKGQPQNQYEIEAAIRVIADNPLPDLAPIMVSVLNYKWPFREQIQWALWNAAAQFVDSSVYQAAVVEAKNPSIGSVYADLVYKTIYRNRTFLSRKDVLAIVGNRKLDEEIFGINDNLFGVPNNNGFYPTIFLALVSKQEDMEKLADFCSRFIPVRISHDPCHAHIPDRRLTPIREAFLRYPESAKEALRKVLKLGAQPGQFKPWAHEFSNGLTPRPLTLFGEWLAELKDTQSIPILEDYARERPLPFTPRIMMPEAPSFIAKIDGPDAMKALRRLNSKGVRAKLGDPAAIDSILREARSSSDNPGQGYRLLSLVFSILEPTREFSVGDTGSAIEEQWKMRRAEFVKKFIQKYGFDPDSTKPGG
jgi:hypothetical protein